MKKTALFMVSLAVCAGNVTSVEAYSKTEAPWSKTRVALTSTAIGAAAWLATYFMATNSAPTRVAVGVSSPVGVFGGISAYIPEFKDNKAMTIASVVAALATGVSAYCFSSYTAQEYAHSAQDIMSGEKCSQPEVLDLVNKCAGNTQVLADSVVNYFAAQKNELVKAASALEELFNQLALANHYFEVAKKGMDDANVDLMCGMQDIITAQCQIIKDASMEIKAKPAYETQRNAEMQELSVCAQFATASAIREFAYAPRVSYVAH